MKNFIVKFLHTDGSIREVKIQGFNEERARLRFLVNWGEDMKILNILCSKGQIDKIRK